MNYDYYKRFHTIQECFIDEMHRIEREKQAEEIDRKVAEIRKGEV
jgi:hypothetical protein